MSHDNVINKKLFSFLTTFLFTLLLTMGVVLSYVKSFLPDTGIRPFLIAAIISAAVFSFALQFKRRGLIFLSALSVLVIIAVIKRKELFQSAGSAFLPLYASYMKDPAMAQVFSFSETPLFFIIIFVIFFSLITAAVIIFNLPAIFCLMFPLVVLAVSILYSNEFIDPFAFMLLIFSVVVVLIERRGLISVNPGAPKSALISAVILLLLSIVLNALIKPFTYAQSERAVRARLSLEDFILDHTPFYVDVNTGNIQFGNGSGNTYAWIKDEKYSDISGGSLRGNSREVLRIEPPESYPAYIKINEYSDYDGRGWAKIDDDYLRVPDDTVEALQNDFFYINYRIGQEEQTIISDYLSDGTLNYPGLKDISISELNQMLQYDYVSTVDIKDLITIEADTIKDYVSKAAKYDKGIEKPPAGVDIADYFLHVSKRGYCIHFATAATLLLRMQGIPARFVTGYLVTERAAGSDGKIAIMGDDGHAWCEYYDSTEDEWKILDATPADPSRVSSSSSSQSYEKGEVNVNPSGEVDDTDPDDTDDEEDDETDDEEDTPKADEKSDTKADSQDEYLERMAEKGRRTWTFIIVTAVVVLSLILSLFIGRALYRKNLTRGTNKKRIIKYYRAIKLRRRLKRIKTKLPDNISEVVMKARFSQHEMTKEELDIVKDYYESLPVSSG